MQPKVCLVLLSFTSFNRAWTQILRNLGIDYTLCVATSTSVSANIQTPQGVFAASSTDLRNYFRQFDAVILCDNTNNLNSGSFINYSVFWLNWNDPEDPPFLFFNPHFSTAITESGYNSNFPSDFPIVRPNPSDIPNTLYAADGGTATVNGYRPTDASNTRLRGACVLFLAENIRAHVPTVCNTHTNNIPYYWRLDADKHAALANTTYTHRVARNGRAGEILAVPAPPTSSEDTETYPADCVVAYRYRNIFWLPHALVAGAIQPNFLDVSVQPFVFWLLYGLQRAGVRPRYRLPVYFETDHPLQGLGGLPLGIDIATQMAILADNWDYMRDFARRKNTAIINGAVVGTKYRNTGTPYHWHLLYSASRSSEERDAAMRVHQILVAGHRDGATPCGIHDHTIGAGNGFWATAITTAFVRHSGLQYGAPNNVPIARGRCCVAPHVLPSGVAPDTAITVQVGDTEMVEWDHPTSGTGTTFDLPMGNIHAARIIIESEIEEMLALGFPDGHCGGHRYVNLANDNSGGECYWQTLREFGFRGVRSGGACNQNLNTKRIPHNRVWRGFHFVNNQIADIATPAAVTSRGLYSPSSPAGGDAVRVFLLDHSNDISSNWTTQPVAAWRAYRRTLCTFAARWVSMTAISLSSVFFHPIYDVLCVSPAAPLAPFDGWNRLNTIGEPHFAYVRELLETMDAIVQLLPEYLYWGTITDVMDHRERVMAG